MAAIPCLLSGRPSNLGTVETMFTTITPRLGSPPGSNPGTSLPVGRPRRKPTTPVAPIFILMDTRNPTTIHGMIGLTVCPSHGLLAESRHHAGRTRLLRTWRIKDAVLIGPTTHPPMLLTGVPRVAEDRSTANRHKTFNGGPLLLPAIVIARCLGPRVPNGFAEVVKSSPCLQLNRIE